MSEQTIIDWEEFGRARSELGADFLRILGYFREDGAKSITALENAMRAKSAVALVIPAHTLKGEALQFGAQAVAALAERIETVARDCVEWHETPEEVLPEVAQLRPLLDETLAQFDRETNPLVERRGFGRKPVVTNQNFGRI